MSYVVAMKEIPDLQQIRIRDRKPLIDGVPLTFGAIDKNALEAAVQLKEIDDSEVVLIGVGSEELEDTVKEAVASGADRSILVADDDAANLSSFDNATILSNLIKQVDDTKIAFFAEGSGDNYSGQVGSIVAGILGWPQVSQVVDVVVDGENATVTRSLEEGSETLELKLPAVLMVSGAMNIPRMPSVMAILKANKAPKEVMTLDEIDFEPTASRVETLENLAPVSERLQEEIGSVDDIVNIIRSSGF